jgi:hypothetical protein
LVLILSPKFDWLKPDEWVAKLIREGLYLQLTITTNKASIFKLELQESDDKNCRMAVTAKLN